MGARPTERRRGADKGIDGRLCFHDDHSGKTKQILFSVKAGFYESPWGKHPRLQLLTIEELLEGKKVDMPLAQGVNVTFEKAPRAKGEGGRQRKLLE